MTFEYDFRNDAGRLETRSIELDGTFSEAHASIRRQLAGCRPPHLRLYDANGSVIVDRDVNECRLVLGNSIVASYLPNASLHTWDAIRHGVVRTGPMPAPASSPSRTLL